MLVVEMFYSVLTTIATGDEAFAMDMVISDTGAGPNLVQKSVFRGHG